MVFGVLRRLVKGSAYGLQLTLLTVLAAPVVAYGIYYTPSEDEQLKYLREHDRDLKRTQTRTQQMAKILDQSREQKHEEREQEYHRLLRGGAGSVRQKTGHHYTGKLAAAQKADEEHQTASRLGLDQEK